MSYKSKINLIWAKLSTEGSARRPTSSRQTFENVCRAFYQAENCPESEPASMDVRTFRAEYNIWAYYFGEDVRFPSRDPGQDNSVSSNSFPKSENSTGSSDIQAPLPSPTQIRHNLESIWASRRSRSGYQPQLGWNPTTGEPWMAVRAYATNSYPALSGRNQVFLHNFQDMIPDFVVQYERFPEQRHTLIWPEFADPRKLMNQGTWEEFGRLRAFLVEWAAHTGTAPNIDAAFKEFRGRSRDQRKALPLPAGFVLDRAWVATLPVPSGTTGSSTSSRQSSRADGRSMGSAGRSGRSQIDSYRPSQNASSRRKSDSSGTLGPRQDDRNRVVKPEKSRRSINR